jgi:uncharacterized iron-regulated membrane protein
MTLWERWIRRPQDIWLRRALFQVHLWSGLGVGLYLVVICATGSVLVYRNELYSTFSPRPVVVRETGRRLTEQQLAVAAGQAYPGYTIGNVQSGETAQHAVEITLIRDNVTIRRLFHPYTGRDLGDPLPMGFRVTAWLLDLHDNLLAGPVGRRVNGVGALCLLLLCATGAVIWWPGVRNWRRSLTIDLRPRSKRLAWSLHSTLGFWTFLFLLMWGITGAYLAYPDIVAAAFDYVEPFDEHNPDRVGDQIQYWLGYLHFGRLGGRGIPGCGRGICNTTTKFVWAIIALVPPVMFVTGVSMWWARARARRTARRVRQSARRAIG